LKKIVLIILLFTVKSSAQRSYKASSVLNTGKWARIGITTEGIYKIDVALLNTLGFTNANIPSSSIQVYGNGGAMLPENNATNRIDDLFENAIWIEDGGDGIFNGNDFALLYAPGPHHWRYDTAFFYQKNLYTDTAFYFVTLGSNGKRINTNTTIGTPNYISNSYTDLFVYEPTTANLLNSGKQWVGDPFSNSFGGITTRNYAINWPGLINTEPIIIKTKLVARTIGANASFRVSSNSQTLQTLTTRAVAGDLLDDYAIATEGYSSVSSNTPNPTITIQFNSTALGASGWLQQLAVTGTRNLTFVGNGFLRFRDQKSIGTNRYTQFNISNAPSGTIVWNITNPLIPYTFNLTPATSPPNPSTLSFTDSTAALQNYIAFTPAMAVKPIALGMVENQNLHNSRNINGIIITHPSLSAAANALANFHQQQYGLIDWVITTPLVYNEFGSGQPDPTAIRDFVKMVYDRNQFLPNYPPYIILFGKSSFDPKNRISNNTNLVPGWQSTSSFNQLTSITSDDYFTVLGNTDNINTGTSNSTISVGRFPVSTHTEAMMMVNKIIHYHSNNTVGNWKKELIVIADDQDNNLHLTDAETIAQSIQNANPFLHTQKIYLDAFPLVAGAGGATYPAANEALVNGLLQGALVANYSGHGNDQRLAQEAVFSNTELNRLNNKNKLPLFVTASCDFAPYDDPTKKSLGEALLYNNENGAVGLLTTTRAVVAASNLTLNKNFIEQQFIKQNGQYPSIGEAVRMAKNNTIIQTNDALNSRKFALLGDPAMKLANPQYSIQLQTLNGLGFNSSDSLRSGVKYTLTGSIVNTNNSIQQNFQGIVELTIYDKPQQQQTLANTAGSNKVNFTVQDTKLFNGQATVQNGQFRIQFILPKDIRYGTGNGLISAYATASNNTDAGSANTINISNTGALNSNDTRGPDIQLFLHDSLFKPGGLSNENPLLIATLSDSSGINATGNSIGHDIVLTIDGDTRNRIVLNSFYTADIDSYQKGQIRFQLPTLTNGMHTLTLKAWDLVNNANEATLSFLVSPQEKLEIRELRNFPNPFNTGTTFSFEHNQPNTNLEVEIQIVNTAGQLVKKITQTLNSNGTRVASLYWQGDTDNGRKLGRGMYFYRIIVLAAGQQKQLAQRLLLQ
jgi:hypothetical protein